MDGSPTPLQPQVYDKLAKNGVVVECLGGGLQTPFKVGHIPNHASKLIDGARK